MYASERYVHVTSVIRPLQGLYVCVYIDIIMYFTYMYMYDSLSLTCIHVEVPPLSLHAAAVHDRVLPVVSLPLTQPHQGEPHLQELPSRALQGGDQETVEGEDILSACTYVHTCTCMCMCIITISW